MNHNPTSRAVSIALIIIAAACMTACSVTPARVDPYAGLLPAGRTVSSQTMLSTPGRVSFADKRVALVTGANFEAYALGWKNVGDRASSLPFQDKAETRRYMDSWSPANFTGEIVVILKRRFKDVVIASDFSDAINKQADWIVLFDHAFDMPSTFKAVYTNTTQIDLLDTQLNPVVHVEFSEPQDRGFANGSADVERIVRQRAIDIQKSVHAASRSFETKLDSLQK